MVRADPLARLAERYAGASKARLKDEWVVLPESSQTYCTPVLSFGEVSGILMAPDSVVQQAPVLRFSRMPGAVQRGASVAG